MEHVLGIIAVNAFFLPGIDYAVQVLDFVHLGEQVGLIQRAGGHVRGRAGGNGGQKQLVIVVPGLVGHVDGDVGVFRFVLGDQLFAGLGIAVVAAIGHFPELDGDLLLRKRGGPQPAQQHGGQQQAPNSFHFRFHFRFLLSVSSTTCPGRENRRCEIV